MSLCSRAFKMLRTQYGRRVGHQRKNTQPSHGAGNVWHGLEPLERRALLSGLMPFEVVALENTAAGQTALVFTDLFGPVLNDAGQVGFMAQVIGPGVDDVNNTTLWAGSPSDPTLVARSGDPTPGIDNASYGFFFDDTSFNLSPTGQVIFSNLFVVDGTTDPNEDPFGFGLWTGPADNVQLAERFRDFLSPSGDGQGDQPEDFALLTGGDLVNGHNHVALVGVVVDEAMSQDDPFIDAAVWSGPVGGFELVARKGDPAPGTDGTFGDTFIPVALTDSGQIVMLANVVGDGTTQGDALGIWFGDAAGLELVAQPGDLAIGVDGSVFGEFLFASSVNDAGKLAILATLDDGANGGIWAGQAGDLKLVVREGDPAAAAGDGVLFSVLLSSPVVNAEGDVLFTSLLEGPGVDETNDVGIWRAGDDGLQLIARTGDAAADVGPGVAFESLTGLDFGLLEETEDTTFPLLVANGQRQVVFTAKLGGEGVDESNDRSIWVADGDGHLRMVVREGQQIEVGEGDTRTVGPDAFSLMPDEQEETVGDFFVDDLLGGVISGGQDGRRTVFSDDGQLVLPLGFTDGNTGIFLFDASADVPEGEVDLSAQFDDVNLPPAVVAGQDAKGQVKVVVTNTGTVGADEPVEVGVVLRPVGVGSDAQDISVATGEISGLNAGASKTVQLKVIVGETVPQGQYNLVAVVDGVAEDISDDVMTVDEPFGDLTGEFADKLKLQDKVVPGDKVGIPIVVTNKGNVAVDGVIDIKLFVSTDQTIDEGDIEIETDDLAELRVKLKPGKSKTFRFGDEVPFDPETLPPGQYFMLARIETDDTTVDSGANNNTIDHDQSGQPVGFEVVWDFGNVDGRRGRTKLVGETEEDDEQERVTIQLTGSGFGQIVADDDGEGMNIELFDTDASTKVKINVKGGDGRLDIDNIIAVDPVGSFDGRSLDLLGNATFEGGIEKLRLGDVAHDHEIFIGGSIDSKPVTIEMDRAIDVRIESLTPIKSLIATELLSADGGSEDGDSPSEVIAPSIAKLQIKGDKKDGVAGDFNARLVLDGSDEAKDTLANVKIAGGVVDVAWEVTGDVGKIAVDGPVVGWTLITDGSVDGLKLGSVQGASVEAGGDIKSIEAVQWEDGSIEALTLKSIKIKGDRRDDAIDGDFDADLTLNPDDVDIDKALGKAQIAGGVEGSAWTIHGDTGRIDIRGTIEDWSLAVMSDLNGLKLGEVVSATVHVDGDIKKIESTQWLSGSIEADTIGVLMTKGGRRHEIAGDFVADLTLGGPDDGSKAKVTLGKAQFAGLLSSSQWTVADAERGAAGVILAQTIDPGFHGSFNGDVKTVISKGDAGGFFAGESFQKMDFKANVTDLTVLTGATLGSDGQLGGDGDAADGFGTGDLKNFRVGGHADGLTIRVGMDPTGTEFDDGNDVLDPDSQLGRFQIVGQLSQDSVVFAANMPDAVSIDKQKVDPLEDGRFRLVPV